MSEKEKITEAEMLEIAARLSNHMNDELSLFRVDFDTKDRIIKALVVTTAGMTYNELPH